MLVVGLTGGIGCGKSTVAEHFRALGTPLIDSDQVAREVVTPGSEGLNALVAHFGPSVLNPDGELNRGALRQRIFDDPRDRRQVEAILHPRIRKRVEAWLAAQRAPYVIQVVPLLLEKGLDHSVDRVLVVDCSPEEQLARVLRRDQSSREQVEAIIATQVSRAERLARADDVLANGDGDCTLRGGVARLDAHYRRLGEASAPTDLPARC